MPISCGTSVLTGQDGSIWFKPAGTSVCLLASDFDDATDTITLPNTHDFKVGDPVTFAGEPTGGGATVPTELNATGLKIATINGNKATLAGAGGTQVNWTTGPTTPAGSHINMSYAEFKAVCNVSNFDLNLTRARIDITSLPCNFTTQAAARFAPFRTYQPGFADGQGTMTVKFTRDQTSLASRLLANSLLRVQDGAVARLFIDTVVGSTGQVDLTESSYIEVALSIEGMNFSVTTDDAPTEATINFSFQSNPTHVFYTSFV